MEHPSPSETAIYFQELYRAFNTRRIDTVLASLVENVDWPNGMESGRIQGKANVREYWLRQWKEIDPLVEPIEISTMANGEIKVRVHQLVRDHTGHILMDLQLLHVYRIEHGLISRMEIVEV